MILTPATARAYWRALLDNATRLIADANLLLAAASIGRARALTVLAEEELGKATTVYDTFSRAWSKRSLEGVELAQGSARDHLAKYAAAYEFGRDLDTFWGDDYPEGPEDDDWARWHAERQAEARAAAKVANQEKQRGFYVDLGAGEISTPAQFDRDRVEEHLVTAAQVIEMMLIRDHSRMKFESPDHYDSTHDMQWRVMPVSHGLDYAAFVESAAEGAGDADDSSRQGDPAQ
ncbi:AbiV family abortive infection protein [Microbacterium sp. BLY]|uniref:AbiV family abortive infection protein n=1 Tax=Microbacterium sp. BLY TaxID=2823280 RepID=UPI001B333E81|nr:AbiV family abortive infection protein [Microbacterium sp. BLY]MBP3977857.1 AbiV family abortive infection protein [Microbacterium sp. BLY]